ncbi:Asp-tRNA(Asn)/Glu-tRNA(Gln) amidotransferase subunit GatC [Salibacteraceae bacterium]|jgi:aspartyl-tRNA(Asn)/glutamyl-tRNA(Gln) amidotransferase subunit C|nr:Asp-tRNA(Asn)/Glu-tRNA(Gln) amidotransferase subunit GatC [Bacteroidota bacterium]MDB9725285.1 Asp-tRNA(Asn)/Glu-tRNA(Gln) amidotransferase subunit GatC [Salibacteraceae bacterium]
MKINNELIDKIASLSKLEFEGEEKAAIKSDLTRMLDFIEKLQSVPTEGVEPLIYMTDEKGKTRLDESKVTISKEEALKNAPQKDSFYFKVPKVINKG